MLDHFAIHIRDVEGAVGRVCETDGTKPIVARGEKLRRLLVRCALGFERNTVGQEFLAMHQVAAHVGDESIAQEIGTESGSAINRDAARAGEISGCAPAAFHRTRDKSSYAPFGSQHSPWFIRADAKHGG